jgi:cytochrome c
MMKSLLIGLSLAVVAAVPASAADFAQVQPLLAKNGCEGCHAQAGKVTGPSYHDIAARYINKPDARTYLAGKIREGSANTWGAASMPPNPTVDDLDMKLIVDWLASGALVPAAAPAPAPAPAPTQ